MNDNFKMVEGFSDTLPLFLQLYPSLKKQYSLKKLYAHFIGEEFPAHDAAEDCIALSKLISKCDIATPIDSSSYSL